MDVTERREQQSPFVLALLPPLSQSRMPLFQAQSHIVIGCCCCCCCCGGFGACSDCLAFCRAFGRAAVGRACRRAAAATTRGQSPRTRLRKRASPHTCTQALSSAPVTEVSPGSSRPLDSFSSSAAACWSVLSVRLLSGRLFSVSLYSLPCLLRVAVTPISLSVSSSLFIPPHLHFTSHAPRPVIFLCFHLSVCLPPSAASAVLMALLSWFKNECF